MSFLPPCSPSEVDFYFGLMQNKSTSEGTSLPALATGRRAPTTSQQISGHTDVKAPREELKSRDTDVIECKHKSCHGTEFRYTPVHVYVGLYRCCG